MAPSLGHPKSELKPKVLDLASKGFTEKQISEQFDVSPQTISRYYPAELKMGKAIWEQKEEAAFEKIKANVENMAALGLPHKTISILTGIPVTTLIRQFDTQLLLGKAKAGVTVAKSMYQLATSDETPHAVRFQAARYWLTTQLGWQDETMKISIENTVVPLTVNFINPVLQEMQQEMQENSDSKERREGRPQINGQTTQMDPGAEQGELQKAYCLHAPKTSERTH